MTLNRFIVLMRSADCGDQTGDAYSSKGRTYAVKARSNVEWSRDTKYSFIAFALYKMSSLVILISWASVSSFQMHNLLPNVYVSVFVSVWRKRCILLRNVALEGLGGNISILGLLVAWANYARYHITLLTATAIQYSTIFYWRSRDKLFTPQHPWWCLTPPPQIFPLNFWRATPQEEKMSSLLVWHSFYPSPKDFA